MKLWVIHEGDFGAYHEDGTTVVAAESKEQAVNVLMARWRECNKNARDEGYHDCYGSQANTAPHVRLDVYSYDDDEAVSRKRESILALPWQELDMPTEAMVIAFNFGCDC